MDPKKATQNNQTVSPAYPIGLTGGIGSGKSTVANLFAARGVTLIDADEIAHLITAPGGMAIGSIRQEFGTQALTPEGAMDRDKMRALVFSDDTAKARLEAILHPMIRDESKRRFAEATSPYVLLVIPLLFESGNWKKRTRRTLLVDCPEHLQIERVMRRSGISEEQVRAIMGKQMSRAERLALADDVIDNSGDGSELPRAVDDLHQRYLTMAEQVRPSVA